MVEKDIEMMHKAFKELDPELEIAITYLTLNKNTNVKLFCEDKNTNNLSNCPPGTIIQDQITSQTHKDFYLISQKTRPGVLAQPTHYYIAYDDKGVVETDVHLLVYKLCYLYYNFSGASRIPAPCLNVKKLLRLITEKVSDNNNTTIPSDPFKSLKGLYYL